MAIVLMLLGSGFYLLLQSPYVQTSLVGYVTRYVEATTGVKMQVGGVDFRPIRSLALNDVLIRDFRNDTLLYCKELRVETDSLNFLKHSFHIREIVLDEADVRLWVQDSTNKTNIEILLDSLSRPIVPTGLSSSSDGYGQEEWWVGLQRISFRNSRFVYQEEIYKPEEYGVNWTDVDCRNLNFDITGIDFTDSPMKLEVSGLRFVEKSGLLLKNMSGSVQAGAGNLLITNCHFELRKSSVDLLRLEYNWVPNRHDWKYFTSRMQQYYELGPSEVSFIDLAYFNEVLRGITNTVKCSGVVTNTVSQLEGRDLYFEWGEKSVFKGNFKSAGLPDVWNTVFNIELQKAHFGPEDLASVYLPWFGMNIPVPSPLHNLPALDFDKIRFDGTFADFMVYAGSITPALQGELNFVYGPCKDSVSDCNAIRGGFLFNQIDFGRLTGLSMLGNGSWRGTYEGTLDTRGPVIHANSELPHLQVNKETIQDIAVDMVLENGLFDLLASVDDPLMEGGCALIYDMSDSLSYCSVKGELDLPDLGALGFGLIGGPEAASTAFDMVSAGFADRSFFNLTLKDLRYANRNGAFAMDNLCVED
ncbi:MAG: hypothetical protein K2I90_05520, partial [Odoribacter sp.]|nr:hypothetical protein [Odoribacter sp.]